MNIKTELIILICTVALSCTSLSPLYAASTGKTKSNQQKAESKKIAYSTIPFNLTVEKLPANYEGHNIIDIYRKLHIPRPKGEFEKTEEYEARVARWEKKPILGAITPTDTLAFELSEFLPNGEQSLQYDADREELTATFIFEDRNLDSVETNWLETFYLYKNLGSHIGKTAMGVKFRVTSQTRTSVGFGVTDTIREVSLSKKMPRTEVLKIKHLVKAFAIVQLEDPYEIYDTYSINASLSKPEEWLIHHIGLHVSLKAIWLVNKKTGEVLVKREAKEGKL